MYGECHKLNHYEYDDVWKIYAAFLYDIHLRKYKEKHFPFVYREIGEA